MRQRRWMPRGRSRALAAKRQRTSLGKGTRRHYRLARRLHRQARGQMPSFTSQPKSRSLGNGASSSDQRLRHSELIADRCAPPVFRGSSTCRLRLSRMRVDPLVAADAEPADPEHAQGHYARSKAMAELLALVRRSDAPGFDVVAVRPHLVWGPGDTQLVGRIVAASE